MARRGRAHYHVYVVELGDAVWNNARFRRCNPDYRLGMPFVYVGKRKLSIREGGVLADVAPTLLNLMGLEQPKEMTGKSIVTLL